MPCSCRRDAGAEPGRFDDPARRAEGARPQGRSGVRGREGGAARRMPRTLAADGARPPRRSATRPTRDGGAACCGAAQHRRAGGAGGRRGRLRRARARRRRRATSLRLRAARPPELGELLGAIDMERGAKVSGCAVLLPDRRRRAAQLALLNLAMAQAMAAGFVPMIPPVLVKPEVDGGHRVPRRRHAEDVYRLPDDDLYLVGTSEVPLAALPHGRDPRRRPAAAALRRAGRPASAARPGRTARTPGASSACTSSTRSRCSPTCRPEDAQAEHQRLLGVGEGDARQGRGALPGDRRRGRRPRARRRRASSTARRGCRRRAATAS